MTFANGLTHISEPLRDVLKEIVRRVELPGRLEAELGREMSDEDFLAIAERDGETL